MISEKGLGIDQAGLKGFHLSEEQNHYSLLRLSELDELDDLVPTAIHTPLRDVKYFGVISPLRLNLQLNVAFGVPPSNCLSPISASKASI